MTLGAEELPIVTGVEDNPYTGRQEVKATPERVTNISEQVQVVDVDPDNFADAEEIRKMREKYGYDDKISRSAEVIQKEKTKMDAETLVRFRTIVSQAQFAVNLFTDQDLLPSLNALLRPGTTLGEPGSIWYEKLYDNGEYGPYLQKLIPILQAIKDATAGGSKLTLDQVKGFIGQMQAIEAPQTAEVAEYYADKPSAGGRDQDLFVLQKLGERARDFLLKNGYEDKTEAYNLEEVAGIMMLSSDNKFRTGHSKELMNAKGEVQLHNLLAWFYDQLTYFSDFQDDDPLGAYQSIGFYTSFRQITAAELIIYNPKRYFAHRVDTGQKKLNEQQTRSEDAGWIPIFETDNNYRPYQRLRDYLVTVVTNSGLAHDFGIQYEKTKEDRDKWLDNMRQIYGEERSEFGNRLLRWLNLLGTSKDEVYAYLNGTANDHQAGGTVGQALRRSLLAYNYFDQLGLGDLTDPENMFIKALGKQESKFAFFRSIILQSISDNEILNQQKLRVEKTMYEEKQRLGKSFDINAFKADPRFKTYFEYLKFVDSLKNADTELAVADIFQRLKTDGGSILFSIHKDLGLDGKNLDIVRTALTGADGFNGEVKLALALAQAFKNYNQRALNYFDQPVSVPVRKEQREFVQNALGAAMKTEYGMSDEDAAYVQEFAMLMPGWLGLSSKNDASTNSLNFWGTMINFYDYRKDHMSQVYTGETESLNGILHFMTALEALAVQVHEGDKVRTISLLEYLQGGDGSDIEAGIERNRYARGEFLVNTGKKYYAEHLNGMVKMREAFYNNRGLDLGDIIKHQPGTGEPIIDPKKLDEFKKFWSASRNAFAKNGSVPWYTMVYAREKYVEDGKEKYRFVKKTLAEYIFHESVVGKYDPKTKRWVGGMNVNNGPTPSGWQREIDEGKLGKQGELFVRDLIGWAVMNSFRLHKFHLNPFTAPKYYENDPLWEKWELGMFRHVHEFFLHMPLSSEEEVVKYNKGPWWQFWNKGEVRVQKMTEGFFSEEDLKDIEKKSKATYASLLGFELGTGMSGSILGLIWQILKGTFGQSAKFK